VVAFILGPRADFKDCAPKPMIKKTERIGERARLLLSVAPGLFKPPNATERAYCARTHKRDSGYDPPVDHRLGEFF